MKKQMSLSFLFLALLALFTLGNVLGVFRSFFQIFRSLSIMTLLNFAINAVKTLAPLGISVLLYLNTKRDVKAIAVPVMVVCGCAWLLAEVLRLQYLPTLFSQEIYQWVPTLIGYISNILVGCLFLMGASCVKKQKKNGFMVAIASLGIYISVVPLLLPLFIGGQFSLLSGVTPLLLLAGVCLLPVTIFDYEHCIKLNGTSIKVIGLIAAGIFVVYLFSGAFTSSGSSGSYGRTCAAAGCSRKAVTSGDSVYCSSHSNRCGNCGCYIDGDAMFCMDCLRGALGK